jgi:hypothetical protein
MFIRAHEDPVLREQDFQAFDLESVFQTVGAVASLLAKNNSA